MIPGVKSEGGRTYRFGPFALDPDNAQLSRDGVPVKLAPQPFTVLQTLLEHAGTLVTRDQLRRIVWRDDHHVDFNAGLNFCLAQIRTALGESTTDPIYIATVPRRGYKFIAPLDVAAATAAGLPGDVPPSVTPVRLTRRWVGWVALAFTASVVTVAAVIWRPALFAAKAPESRSIDAITAFERGTLDLADASPGELQARVRFFEDAIKHDAQFGRAYAGLAEARLMLAEYRGDEPQRAYAMAKASAQQALALDPELAEAHAVMAAVLWQFNWDWPAAERHLRLAQRGTASPMVLLWASRFRAAQGRAGDALVLAERAVSLSPRSARMQANLGMMAVYAGDHARAVEACQRASSLIAKFTPADMCLVTAAAETRQLALAIRHARAVADGSPEQDVHSFDQLWRARLLRLDQHRESCRCDHDALSFAMVHARLGEPEPALTWLERAADLHADGLVFAAVHPALRSLHGHSRFQVVLDKVGVR
jgi:DNA-binding winged helix-turn-helix (wHTH) protein/tetratricopeptide (TPR) repeat protein